MIHFINALQSFFSTSVGTYWVYMWVGIGVTICVIDIISNLRR